MEAGPFELVIGLSKTFVNKRLGRRPQYYALVAKAIVNPYQSIRSASRKLVP